MSMTHQINDVTRSLVDESRRLAASAVGQDPGFDVSLLNDTDRFFRWAPFDLVKGSGAENDKLGLIKGVATTEMPDDDGDIIKVDGIDWSYFVGDGTEPGRGFLLDEHPVGNHNIVGFPQSVSPTEVIAKGEVYKGANVAGALYLEKPRGLALYESARVMRRAGGQRRLGFSIEGSVAKGGRDGRVVTKSQVKWLAITAAPKNELTWWEPVAKSLLAAVGNDALVKGGSAQDRHITNVAALVLRTLNRVDPVAELGDELCLHLMKAHPDMTWRDAVGVLHRSLSALSQSPQAVPVGTSTASSGANTKEAQ